MRKYILRQHQTAGMEKVVQRALDPKLTRGLIWHTQGSGKTYTMIKSAELLFKAPEAEKPTILMMIDRNELEDQMLKNLISLGLNNVEHAHSIARLNQLLKSDYRGIVVTTIQKFQGMPANINERKNIYVLVDEAHRSTGSDLGNYLMAGLPNATYIGLTGTPIDKTVYGRGTLKPSVARTIKAISTSTRSPRASRMARPCRSSIAWRRMPSWCRTKSWKRSSFPSPRPKASPISKS